MRYTKPIILNEAKAASLIMGPHKRSDLLDSLFVLCRSDTTAYEADE
jgi:hypothetical protein